MPHNNDNLEITANVSPAYAEILSDAALTFVAALSQEFRPRVTELLKNREERQTEIDAAAAQTIASVTNNPNAYGLYNESAFQALALDRPFLSYNSGTSTFTLTVGVLQAPDLFSSFNALTNFTTYAYPESGQIDIEFDAPNSDVRFFQLFGAPPQP